MKSSNKSSIITGTILLSLAAVFTICLILQLLDFGIGGPGHNNIFYYIGNMLITVYGFSSILIPTFLLISGLYCFATIWTAQKTMRLITAILPFFTCVFTEKICRSVLGSGGTASGMIKAVIAAVTGLMLVIIEIIGAGVIAESVNQRIFYKGKTAPKFSKYNEEDEDDSDEFVADFSDDDDDEDDKAEDADAQSEENVEKETEDGQFKYKKISAKKNIFDKALDKLKQKKKDESFEALMESAEEIYDGEVPSIDDYNKIDDKAAAPAPAATVAPAPSAEEVIEEPEPKNPASIISQEEYAALLSEDDAAPAADELEWNNLPPAPTELPPEYSEEIDENDPALSFPPADNMPAGNTTAAKPAEPQNNIADTAANSDNSENSPYAAARYIERVVPNPAYSSGIVIHNEADGSSAAAGNTDAENAQLDTSKYSSKIVLNENATQSDVPYLNKKNAAEQEAQVSEEDFSDVEIADITENTDSADIQDFTQDDDTEYDDGFDPDFFDIDMNNVPADEDLSDDVQPVPEELEVTNKVFNQIAQSEKSEKSVNFSKVTSGVLSDMEKDIRGETDEQDEENEENETISEEDFDIDSAFEEDEDDSNSKANDSLDEDDGDLSPELNPNAGHANNLTADELTDFFNAQQEENTPQHKVIEGPAPKSHKAAKKGPYIIPSNLLTAYKDDQYWIIDDETKKASIDLKQTLSEFNIDADIIGIKKGPVVTMFEILPAPGVKLSKIVALQDNIALSLAAQSVRIVAPIPGKQAVGIEVPNKRRSVVGFREIIEMDLPEWNKMAVPVVLGKDILGKAQLIDLVKTPHMLIAGATGSGKSVCVNSLILSILYKRSFKDVKMILVDPKVVELKLYNNIPHLLTPVITEPKKAIQALQFCLCEMERRYALLDGLGVRDISSYNERIKERDICTEKLPYIVVIIDEFADLMATSGKELENIVARLTAMSRAVGIHLVLATQRPSTNVITGLIKANIPSRIAFMVASRIDSQIIIDGVGAEKLLGRGDMLYASAVDPAPIRIQGTYVDDNEVEKVVECVKQYGEPDYIDDQIFVDDDEDEEGNVDLFGNNMDEDPLYDQALEIVVQSGKASASYIQRRLKIGYNRAARLVEEMEERGIVGPANGSKPREIIHIPS